MRNLKLFGLAILTLGILGVSTFRAADKDADDPPKYSIKQVMRMAHRAADKKSPTLADKVITGKATEDEQAKLLELYTAMAANKPPKGSADAWKDKNTAILDAIKAVQSGKDGADVDLRKAMSCNGCHSSHRGR